MGKEGTNGMGEPVYGPRYPRERGYSNNYARNLMAKVGAKQVTPPISAADLMAMDFPEPEMVIEGVLPVGVTLLVGKPKKGKSWMALGMCEAVAAGGKAFGVKGVSQGEALYLALEDNKRRIRKRLKKVLDGRDAPKGMYVETDWPRIDEGGADRLDEYFEANPDTRLVVIDTLAKVRKPVRGANVYAEDYAALEPLLPLAQKHNVAIVIVYHLRKAAAADPMDEISSSTGLTAGVDGFLILRRVPGSKGPTLFVDGRDIEEPTEYALHWNLNTATWTIEGTAEEVHLSKERGDILLTLNRSPEPMTPKEVWEAMGGKRDRIRQLLVSMFNDGQVLKDEKGRYSPAHPTNPPDPDHTPHSDHKDHSDHSDHRAATLPDIDHSGPFDHSTDHRATADTYQGNEGAVMPVIPVIEGGGNDGNGNPSGNPDDKLTPGQRQMKAMRDEFRRQGEQNRTRQKADEATFLQVLNRHGSPMAPRGISNALKALKVNHRDIVSRMSPMLESGQVLKDNKGRYYPANSTNPSGNPSATPCIHGNPGGKGCYCCDPNHPYRNGGAS